MISSIIQMQFFPRKGSVNDLINKRRNYRYQTALQEDPAGVARFELHCAARRRKVTTEAAKGLLEV